MAKRQVPVVNKKVYAAMPVHVKAQYNAGHKVKGIKAFFAKILSFFKKQ